MHVDVMIRRRPILQEKMPEFNDVMVDRLRRVPAFWAVANGLVNAPFDFEGGESASLDLRGVLSPGLSGQLLYMARFAGYLARDAASADDFLKLRLDTALTDYAQFCLTTLPSLITAFEAYRCRLITDPQRRLADWEIIRNQTNATGRNIDGRDSVYRVWPVSYFDDLLCQRSFGVGAEEVVRRAAPACERAEMVAGGAFLIVTTELIVGPDLDVLNARMMALLDARDPASLPPPPPPKPAVNLDPPQIRWVKL